jgi:hypothetical protein
MHLDERLWKSTGVEAKGTEVEEGKASAEYAKVTIHHQHVFDAGVAGGWRVDVTVSSATCCLLQVEIRRGIIYC